MMIPFKKTEITPCSLSDMIFQGAETTTIPTPLNIIEAKEVSNGWMISDINHQQYIISYNEFTKIENYINQNLIYRADETVRNRYSNITDYGWFSYFPLSLELDITNKCNFNCIHCNRSANSKRTEELNYTTIERIAQETKSLGVKRIQILGGEPTIHPEFYDICKLFANAGASDLFTSTNGWKLNTKTKDILCSSFNTVQVSLHSVNKETHDYIADRENAWDNALESIRVLVAHHVKVIVSMSVIEYNLHEIEKMAEFALLIGAQAIRFLALQEVGRGTKLRPLSPQQLANAARAIDSLQELYPTLKILSAGFPTHPQPGRYHFLWGCAAGRTLMAIHANGKVSCCSIVKEMVGSIYESSIIDIWHNDYFRQLRKIENESCQFANRCGGKCRYKFDNPYITKC